MAKKKSIPYALLAGILFAILALKTFIHFFEYLKYSFDSIYAFTHVLLLALCAFAYTAITILFVLKKRDRYMAISFTVLSVSQIVRFIIRLVQDISWHYEHSYKFRFSEMLPDLFYVIALLFLLCLVTVNFTTVFGKFKNFAGRLWFLPSVLVAVWIVVGLNNRYSTFYESNFDCLLTAIAFATAAIWIVCPSELSKIQAKHLFVKHETISTLNADESIIIRSKKGTNIFFIIAAVIFFGGATIFNERDPFSNCTETWDPSFYYVWSSVLFLIIGIIHTGIELVITDKRVYGKVNLWKRVDLPLDSISAVGTSWFNGISVSTSSGRISFMLISNKDDIHKTISDFLIKRQQERIPESNINNAVQQCNADEIVKFKELLDNGVITQEEFEAKKKQLLGL